MQDAASSTTGNGSSAFAVRAYMSMACNYLPDLGHAALTKRFRVFHFTRVLTAAEQNDRFVSSWIEAHGDEAILASVGAFMRLRRTQSLLPPAFAREATLVAEELAAKKAFAESGQYDSREGIFAAAMSDSSKLTAAQLKEAGRFHVLVGIRALWEAFCLLNGSKSRMGELLGALRSSGCRTLRSPKNSVHSHGKDAPAIAEKFVVALDLNPMLKQRDGSLVAAPPLTLTGDTIACEDLAARMAYLLDDNKTVDPDPDEEALPGACEWEHAKGKLRWIGVGPAVLPVGQLPSTPSPATSAPTPSANVIPLPRRQPLAPPEMHFQGAASGEEPES